MDQIKFERDGARLVVKRAGERIGFLRRHGKLWNAVTSDMERSVDRATREAAVEWLCLAHDAA